MKTTETYQISVHDPEYNIWAEINITGNQEMGFTAQTYLHGPGRGDEILAMVQAAILAKAQELGAPITHEINASNKGAEALARRSAGYTHHGKTKAGNTLFKKLFGG